ARNTVMLSLALGLAEVVGARDIWIGVNAVDYSGYPDCRPEFIEAFAGVANLATKAGVEAAARRGVAGDGVGSDGVCSDGGVNGAGAGTTGNQRPSGFKIHTPLIKLTKAEIVARGTSLGVDYGLTHTCYSPDPAGVSCGRCDACHLRLKGFAEAGLTDPISYQA
ncbi:MAG: 7-cyano-7-deazaguanine synthase, partial [Planctomycetota bacterium]